MFYAKLVWRVMRQEGRGRVMRVAHHLTRRKLPRRARMGFATSYDLAARTGVEPVHQP